MQEHVMIRLKTAGTAQDWRLTKTARILKQQPRETRPSGDRFHFSRLYSFGTVVPTHCFVVSVSFTSKPLIMLRAAFLGLLPLAAAIPAPVAEPTPYRELAVRAPEPTGAPDLIERNIIDDVHTYVDGLISSVDSKVKGFVDSGILDFPTGFPTGSAVEKSLGISDDGDELKAQPTQVLNVP
jgi:hypothetical protein